MSNNITIRMPDADRAILAALADRVAEDIGIELSNTAVIKLAIRRCAGLSPAELFRKPQAAEGRP
jgi:hypothetical protein